LDDGIAQKQDDELFELVFVVECFELSVVDDVVDLLGIELLFPQESVVWNYLRLNVLVDRHSFEFCELVFILPVGQVLVFEVVPVEHEWHGEQVTLRAVHQGQPVFEHHIHRPVFHCKLVVYDPIRFVFGHQLQNLLLEERTVFQLCDDFL